MKLVLALAFVVLVGCGDDDGGTAPPTDAGPDSFLPGPLELQLYDRGCIDELDCAYADSVCIEDARTGDTYCTVACESDCDAPATCTMLPSGSSLCVLPD